MKAQADPSPRKCMSRITPDFERSECACSGRAWMKTAACRIAADRAFTCRSPYGILGRIEWLSGWFVVNDELYMRVPVCHILACSWPAGSRGSGLPQTFRRSAFLLRAESGGPVVIAWGECPLVHETVNVNNIIRVDECMDPMRPEEIYTQLWNCELIRISTVSKYSLKPLQLMSDDLDPPGSLRVIALRDCQFYARWLNFRGSLYGPCPLARTFYLTPFVHHNDL